MDTIANHIAPILHARLQRNREEESRKKAEETIKQQNEFIRNVIESMPHPFYVIDAKDYTILMANSVEVFKESSEPSTCYELTHNYDKPCEGIDHICPLEEVKRTRKSACVEHIHFDNDNNLRNIEVHSYPIFNENGNVIQMIEYCLDITERKQAEEALRESEQRLMTIFNFVQAGLIIIDKETRKIAYANPTAIEMIGFPIDRIIGSLCHEFICPAELGKCPIYDLGQGIDKSERVLLKAHGERLPIIKSVTSKIIEGRECLIESFIDISPIKEAEKKLRESEEKYRNILENIQEGYFEVDLAGKYTFFNDAFCKMYRYPRDELLGMSYKQHMDESSAKYMYEIYNEIYRTRQPAKAYQRELIRKDGKRLVTEATASLITDPAGKPVGFRGIVRDITERKKAGEEIKASLREKEILLKEIHHRVKNNLQVIISMLNLQQKRIDNEEAQMLFLESQNRIRSMALVHERLYQSEDFTKINFTEYVRIIATELHRAYLCDPDRVGLDIKGTKLELGIDQAIPCGLIINELVSNAIKHAFPEKSKRKGNITISLNEKNETVELKVKDNGIGITEDIDIEKGDSLGLKLVTGLVQQLKGKCELPRKKGTAFTIRFPKEG